jgi:hypothetical protein
MDVAAFGTLHDKINIGVIFKAADIVDKRPGERRSSCGTQAVPSR